ncbi:DNA replication and repair protein RecF [Sphingomonas sp. PP-F2F-G114-C0414]|uniref:DNA replication/repair protein RecF n=1 Tax=Sphingomonas sp. PP-F2F-G114-C0414 TaxID=2135662 RepID=UPI000F2BEC72|nr:DNA replication/repair protein RecF [Sphingomonas sp. PP-F2F-G114-C0414]RMB34479.1 DNA replication and repair protein RecF [Sphingomonas sp. PP-F2F-G114-C0414]
MLPRLVLTDFRNHADLTLTPGPGFVVLTGENGAGKTNILEAVSLLAPGRGLRRAALGEMARQGGAGGFGVAATLFPSRLREGLGEGATCVLASAPEESAPPPRPLPQAEGESEAQGRIEAPAEVDVATGTLASAPERRIVRIQGATTTANALAEWLTILWLTPAMDRLFVAPAGERRGFLDRLTLALAPSHAHHAARYDAAMRARNRLLADEGRPDGDWLSALEAQMAEHGAAVDAARRETVTLLGTRLAHQDDGPFPRAGLTLEGWAGDTTRLQADLAQGRARDAAAGRTLTGPHRVDLIVTHLDKARAASLASTGEQKALLLGIVLAHADLVAERTGQPPVLLLDEVAAHLDPARRAALFARLAGRGQVWMTGTEDALFDAIDTRATRIALGR